MKSFKMMKYLVADDGELVIISSVLMPKLEQGHENHRLCILNVVANALGINSHQEVKDCIRVLKVRKYESNDINNHP